MKRTVFLLLSSIVLGACASQKTPPAGSMPTAASYALDAKTMPVGAIPSAILHDSTRNKDLELSIEYPTKEGPYPVIIFSPGYGYSNLNYVGTSAYWTSHGYVVIKPKHADAGSVKGEETPLGTTPERRGEERRDRRRRAQETPQQPPVFRANPAEQWDKLTPADWQNRAADIRLIIDSLPKLMDQYPEIKPRVDATKIGVGGHSYGAFAALLVGGARTFNAAGAPVSYADPRVKAVVAMSPPGPSASRGLTSQSFADLRLPVLFITGSQDFGTAESENAAWRRQAYELSPAGDKWFVSLNGAGAAAFTGRMADVMPYYEPVYQSPDYYPHPGSPGTNPAYVPPQEQRRGAAVSYPQMNLVNAVKTMSLAFWDAYLKNAPAARDYLSKLKERGDAEVLVK